LFFVLAISFFPLYGAVLVDDSDPIFSSYVRDELSAMRGGKRGIVCQVLLKRLDEATTTTMIKPITREESTWHPNDRRGTRSHVVPQDTKLRGAERSTPTGAIVYIHPNRVNPAMSLFRLGSFIYELSEAVDLNTGQFSSDYRIREKRAVFFKNAWCDSLGYGVIQMSDRVPTPEYSKSKELDLLTPAHESEFPILDPDK
jgi:hypothetical protein